MTTRYGTASDYVGRQFDLLALQGAKPVGDVRLAKTMFSEQDLGQVCTGVQKLAQRWLLHLLTVKGSMPFNADDGTSFITDARSGRWRTEEDVQESYEFAAADVALFMTREESDDMHPEDRFQNAVLQRIAILPDRSVSLTIAINSQAGTSRKVILPVAFSPITTTL